MDKAPHPLDQLSTAEIKATTTAINEFLLWTDYDGKVHPPSNPRFSSITLKEPPKAELLAMLSGSSVPPRQAQVIFMIPASGRAYEATVDIVSAPRGASGLVGDVVDCTLLEVGTQPFLLSPDECALAESIVKEDPIVAKLLKERYGITNTGEGASCRYSASASFHR